jgi:hypothetical protein
VAQHLERKAGVASSQRFQVLLLADEEPAQIKVGAGQKG